MNNVIECRSFMMTSNAYGNGSSKILINGEELRNIHSFSIDKDKDEVVPNITLEQSDDKGNVETKVIKFNCGGLG